MPKNISQILRPCVILFFLVVTLFVTNYVPDTWLSGWDNVHSEFRPTKNIVRGLFSVWQDNQSFGNVSGMAFATTLFHSIITWFFSLFLSASLVRYVFIFLLVYLGATGTYFLLRFVGFDEKRSILAYVGAIFYILNFGHIQIMSVPTESFVAFLGLLPWEVLLFLRILGSVSRKESLTFSLIFVVVNIVVSFQFLTQTIFIVYLIVLSIFSLEHVIRHGSITSLKKVVFGMLLILLSSAFWILPQAYFLSSNVGVVANSKINQIATENVINQGSERSNLVDIIRFIGIYYDLYSARGDQIFSIWRSYFSKPIVGAAQFIMFGLIVLGIFRKLKFHLAFVLLFFVSAVAMMYGDIVKVSPFLSQIFRSPFTKFITVYSLAGAYLFVCGLESVSVFIFRFSRFKDSAVRHIVAASVGILVVVYIAIPAFRGNYISPIVKIRYPERYFELMTHFDKEVDPTARVTLLPDMSFWGWFRYSWGYEGSGFLWYGMAQSIVSRTFDVWSSNSESFYWELKYAMESKNIQLFDLVLAKYQVDYLIFDDSLISSSIFSHGAALENLEAVLTDSVAADLYRKFDGISVYKVNGGVEKEANISVFGPMPTVGPAYTVTNWDVAYSDTGSYSSPVNSNPQYYYPFLDFMTQTEVSNTTWVLREKVDGFEISANLPEGGRGYSLVLPSDELLTSKLFLGEGVEEHTVRPKIQTSGGRIVVDVPKLLVQDFDLSTATPQNCGVLGGTVESKFSGPDLTVMSQDRGVACFGYESPLLAHWAGYLVSVETENLTGNDLFFYILGSKSERYSKTEELLDTGRHYLILNPGHFYNDGYVFSFQNQSFGRSKVENKLKHLRVYLFPVEYLKRMRLETYQSGKFVSALSNTQYSAGKINPYTYKIDTFLPGKTLVLWQSYDSGWIALCGFGICDAEHVRINNWANGWVFDNEFRGGKVTLVFWPQYLEYAGFIVVVSTLIWLSIGIIRDRHRNPDY